MRDLSDTELTRLQALLDEWSVAAPRCAPLDVSAVDGYLCGVLLQPQPVAEADWWPFVLDADGQLPAPTPPAALRDLVRRRHAVLGAAIAARGWFDPWLFELESELEGEQDSALPWVAGFALAVEKFPALLRSDEQALAAPLALLYLHFDAEDLEGLEDEPALAAALAATEPPADLAQAAEDLVRAVLLLADISQPRPAPPRKAPGRASPSPGPRSKSARPARARRG